MGEDAAGACEGLPGEHRCLGEVGDTERWAVCSSKPAADVTGTATPQQRTDTQSHNAPHTSHPTTGKFSSVLTEAVNCLAGGLELHRPDERLAAFEPRPGSYTAAAADPDAARAAEECLTEWCKQVDALLQEGDAAAAAAAGDEPGPDTELEHWRQRMAKLNSLSEQLKGREARIVLGICQVMHCSASKRWKVCAWLLLMSGCWRLGRRRGWLEQNEGALASPPASTHRSLPITVTAPPPGP